ncbi:MAG: hypothetical protein FJ254_06730 [Phycisphaerae bacterium]|nr:hypothetical protein [Phycisphaerae bacterium]
MDFVEFDLAWKQLAPRGVIEAAETPTVFRVALEEGSSVIDIAAKDHPRATSLPSDIKRMSRARMAEFVEAIAHKLHLREVLVFPVGKWNQVFDAVSEPMAKHEQWAAIDGSASVELNRRDPILFEQGDHHVLRALVQCVLDAGSEPSHGIGIATTGASLVMEVLPPGELTIYCGTSALAQQLLELMSHLKPDA